MTDSTNRFARDARLKWVPVDDMQVNPLAQRDLNPARVDHLAANFDPEQIGAPTLSFRNGHYFIIDGQHRVEAMKAVGWADQSLQCWVYEGLTEEDEAEKFLKLNDYLAVAAIPKYRAALTAGRDVETDIDRVVRSVGLVVSLDKIPGAIGAVGTLRRVYDRGGPAALARTLHIIRDAYGDPGLEAPVIDGIGHLCQRYNGDLDTELAVQKLGQAHGGANGLLGKAEKIRHEMGQAKGQCIAAAAVEIINQGTSRANKLPSWWKA